MPRTMRTTPVPTSSLTPFRSRLRDAEKRLPSRIEERTLLPMQLNEQAHATMLAGNLGEPAHVSGLAIRLAMVTGAGDRFAAVSYTHLTLPTNREV